MSLPFEALARRPLNVWDIFRLRRWPQKLPSKCMGALAALPLLSMLRALEPEAPFQMHGRFGSPRPCDETEREVWATDKPSKKLPSKCMGALGISGHY